MNSEDYKDILKILEDAGWQPQVCDTPIPVYESVHAGNPEEPGQIPPDMVLVPRAFLSMYPEAMVRVQGNSMIDRNIEDGDWVKMCYGRTPHDGDIVVVAIGSECTVKSYYEDEDGVGWLVPQNKREKEKYKVIRLDEDAGNVHLCGVVTDIRKPLPRVPDKAMKALREFLRPEFISRIDEIIVFKPLTEANYADIAGLMVEEMRVPLAEKGIGLEYDREALEQIAVEAYGKKYGAREIRRVLRERVEDAIASQIIDEGAHLSKVHITTENGEVKVLFAEQ